LPKKDPIIDDKEFFAALDEIELVHRESNEGEWPWSGIPEDREVAHNALTAIYARLGYAKPRFNWARSPYAMYGAMQYLRQMQIQQRQVVVREIMRGGDALEAEVRATFLEGILERDLTVSLGACLANQVFSSRPMRMERPIAQMQEIFRHKFAHPPNGKPIPAGWRDWVAYPLAYSDASFSLRSQALCMFPFLRCVWLCRPPVKILTDSGNLICAKFEDGFEIWRTPDEIDPEEQVRLETDTKILQLPAPEQD
jgi:hypothetical protein